MAKPGGNPQNLVNIADRSTEEQQKIRSMGGKRSGEVRREQRAMSKIWTDLLYKKLKLSDGNTVDAPEFVEQVIVSILERKDAVSMAAIKEWHEATEGSKSIVDATIETVTPEERDNRIRELMAKRSGS